VILLTLHNNSQAAHRLYTAHTGIVNLFTVEILDYFLRNTDYNLLYIKKCQRMIGPKEGKVNAPNVVRRDSASADRMDAAKSIGSMLQNTS
jgi:hypothetical protein